MKIVIVVVLLSTLSLSSCIKSHSSLRKKTNGLVIPLYQQNQLHTLDPLSLAPLTKYNDRIIFYIEFLVGTPAENFTSVFDTGSFFGWFEQSRIHPSKSYRQVKCFETACGDVPGSSCSSSRACHYGVRYADGSTSVGQVGKDIFSLYYSDGKGRPDAHFRVRFQMMYGSPLGNQYLTKSLHGIIGAKGLLHALDVNSFSICYPRPPKLDTFVRFGINTLFFGKTTPLSKLSYDNFFRFTVKSISNGGLVLDSNLTGGAQPGMEFIFDTGASLSHLHPIVFEKLIESVKNSIYAAPLTERIPGGYELCYKSSDRTSYQTLEVMFHIDGPSGSGYLRFNFDTLWRAPKLSSCECNCFSFLRSKSLRSIFGVYHMLGYNFAIDTDRMMLHYGERSCELIKS